MLLYGLFRTQQGDVPTLQGTYTSREVAAREAIRRGAPRWVTSSDDGVDRLGQRWEIRPIEVQGVMPSNIEVLANKVVDQVVAEVTKTLEAVHGPDHQHHEVAMQVTSVGIRAAWEALSDAVWDATNPQRMKEQT